MTTAELAQAGLFWAAGNMAAWVGPVSMALGGFVLAVVHVTWDVVAWLRDG